MFARWENPLFSKYIKSFPQSMVAEMKFTQLVQDVIVRYNLNLNLFIAVSVKSLQLIDLK